MAADLLLLGSLIVSERENNCDTRLIESKGAAPR